MFPPEGRQSLGWAHVCMVFRRSCVCVRRRLEGGRDGTHASLLSPGMQGKCMHAGEHLSHVSHNHEVPAARPPGAPAEPQVVWL